MIFKEFRKNIHPLLFIISLIIVITYVYLNIQPSCKYYYGQPLSKAEFIYIGLKDDYLNRRLTVYEGDNLCETVIGLSENEMEILSEILVKINPKFVDEKDKKFSEITLDCSDSECILLAEELERKLGYKTDYYSMLDYYSYDVYMSKRFHNSQAGYNIALSEEKKDFDKVLQDDVTSSYARYAADSLGMIMGILAVFFSTFIFLKDRKYQMSEFLFTSKSSSLKIIISRVLSAVLPLLFISIICGIFISIFFFQQNIYYGYELNYLKIFQYIFCWILPTITITVTLSVFLDLILENSAMVFIVQFIIWYLSVSNVLGNYNIFQTVIRFAAFGYINVYERYKSVIIHNRILMIFLSAILLGCSALLFELKREGKINLEMNMNLICKKFKTTFPVKRKKKIKAKNHLILYNLNKAVSLNLLLGVLYLFLIIPIVYRKSMTTDDLAVLGENILVFVSAFIMIPLSNIESRNGVWEMVILCKTSYVYIFFQRIVIGIVLTLFLISIPLSVLSLISGAKIGLEILGVFFSSVFLGLIGVLFSELTKKNSIGYLVYIIYYFWCVLMKHHLTFFNVCGYTYQIRNSKNSIILGIIIIMMALFLLQKLRQKGHL